MTEAFRVVEENENGKRIVNLCAEIEMFITNYFFQHEDMYKCTLGALRDNVERRGKIDLILARGDILKDMYDEGFRQINKIGQ